MLVENGIDIVNTTLFCFVLFSVCLGSAAFLVSWLLWRFALVGVSLLVGIFVVVCNVFSFFFLFSFSFLMFFSLWFFLSFFFLSLLAFVALCFGWCSLLVGFLSVAVLCCFVLWAFPPGGLGVSFSSCPFLCPAFSFYFSFLLISCCFSFPSFFDVSSNLLPLFEWLHINELGIPLIEDFIFCALKTVYRFRNFLDRS